MLAEAQRAFFGGAFEEAERLCRSALELSPDLPLANMMLGNLYARRGEWSKAEERFRKVSEQAPSAFEPKEWLAKIALETGRVEEALRISEELVGINPQAPGGYVSLGLCYVKQGRAQEAVPVLRKAVQLAPNFPIFRYNLASALKDAGRPDEALAEYHEALRLDPNSTKARMAIASLLIDMRRTEEAVRHLRKVAEQEPGSASYAQLAHGLAEDERYEEAEEYLRKSIAIDPSVADSHEALGIHLLHEGRLDEAVSSFQRAMELEPEKAGPYFGLSRSRRFTNDDRKLIARMKSLANAAERSPEELRELHYALGKAHEDLREYESAFAHFAQANRYSKETQLSKRPFDKAATRRHSDRLISTFSRQFLATHADLGFDTDLPIFIVGMVRSGTTLCEQVLSRHPRIKPAGELTFWIEPRARDEVERVLQGHVDRQALRSLGAVYLKRLGRGVGPESRATDKMPLNYMSLGLIHLLFPNATIVHCRRDPLDTCVSVFTTPYRDAPDFFYDLTNIAEGYRDYLRIMDHWRSVIPRNRFFEVRYEDMVTNLAGSAPRLVEFCGLEWDEACLRPEQSVRSVRTPSAWQVRQGVYESSIGRWRNYEPWIGPLLELAHG